jgi:hypothetical protein
MHLREQAKPLVKRSQMTDLMKDLDSNGDGKVTLKELVDFLHANCPGQLLGWDFSQDPVKFCFEVRMLSTVRSGQVDTRDARVWQRLDAVT